MELPEAIAKFKTDLDAVKKEGKAEVEIDNLEKYLDWLLTAASLSSEARRLQHASSLAEYNATISMQVENFKVVMAAGKEAINAAIIINGGAVIALMSFMGNAVARSSEKYLGLLSLPLLLFGIGVFCGGVAFGTRYISQFLYAGQSNKKAVTAGHVFNALSWILTAASYLVFAYGVWVSYQGFH